MTAAARMGAGAVILLLLTGCYEDKMREQFRASGCVPIGREKLVDQPKEYCGKACFRHKVRESFACGPDRKDIRSFDY